MKFQKGRRSAEEYEKDLVEYWKKNKTFEKSVESRPITNSYVFYDGPPFITGEPHHGTLLSSIVKDVIPRYWTMKGKRVERVWGWDCHGLPAEVFTEKKMGITDKRDIGTKISLEEYITTCRDNMVQTGDLWEKTIDRIGRWVDFKGAYKTMDKEFMESVWWAFKQLYDKGKIYEGEKVLLYCTRDATPISKAEVAMDNSYQDVTDPSVYVKFELEGDKRCLLVWTTTPWTLNANTALVVGKDIEYSEIEHAGEVFVLASKLVEKVFTDEKHQPIEHKVLRSFKGKELVGLSYKPLFVNRGENAHRVWHADFVTDEDGTGIAHQAPGYGEDDYIFAKKHKVPFVLDTDEKGYYTEGPWKGMQIWEHNKQIAKDLKEQGVVWKIEYITHEYPHCHRCGTKLQYRAHPSWFMDVDSQRTEMLEQNGNINWFPEHIKHGRFEKTVESAPDWNLSRDRFWATAMPVWKAYDSDGKEHIKVVGSYAELKDLSGVVLDDYHRPWIDDVTFTIEGLEYKRIEKVMDCWFESGSMPFAQFHYPFENVDKFEQNFPGDFIAEYVGQVRAWFYYLHAVNVGLFEKNAFKNVIVTGSVMGSDGKKLSKSLGNYEDPNIMMDKFSADALRYALASSPVLSGEDVIVSDKDLADTQRKLSMIWNVYDFFTMYAEVDKWDSPKEVADPSSACTNPLDIWIIARLHELTGEVEKNMDLYDVPNAMKPILPFVDDLSNWYVRRSRRRFWKSGDDTDKNNAYTTLHYVLVRLVHVLAPFTPFLAEELYRSLTDGESVHLNYWIPAGHVNELAVDEMAALRKLITGGLELRAREGIKVRQPLGSANLQWSREFSADLLEIAKEELNVKNISSSIVLDGKFEAQIDKNITPELHREGLVREVIRAVQNARKSAGLDVDDRIKLALQAVGELKDAISEHSNLIEEETLVAGELMAEMSDTMHDEVVKVEGQELRVMLIRA